jgi:hypothetical protein
MRRRVIQEAAACCRHVRWLGLYLLLLVAVCSCSSRIHCHTYG